MGLDMYLYRREYVSGHSFNENDPALFFTIAESLNIKPAFDAPHMHVDICVAYWRKANSVHKWFCDLDGGRDECQRIYVTRDHLVTLRNLCSAVLVQPALASSALPTQGGFFFGSLEYDEWYMEDMKNTVSQLDKVLADTSDNQWADFYYQASW